MIRRISKRNMMSRPLTVLHLSDTHWDPEYLEGNIEKSIHEECKTKKITRRHWMSPRIDGWLWGSPLLQKRKWGCTSWEPKSWQVSTKASLRTLKQVSSPSAEVAHSQVGGLQKMRHSSSHNRGDVQAHCCPSHSRPDLLDWWPASSWHMESVERWKCGGEREIKSNPALWSHSMLLGAVFFLISRD